MSLKLTFWSHFRNLWILLFYFILMYFVLWASDFEQGVFLLAIFGAMALIIPTLIIHLNHNQYCKNRTVVLLQDMIKIESKHEVITIPINDIVEVKIFMSSTRYSSLSIQSFPFENYFYCKIETNSNTTYYLPSLFSDKLDKLLQEKYNVDTKYNRIYYPYINNENIG